MFEILLFSNITQSPYPSAPHRVYCPTGRFYLPCLLAEGYAHSHGGFFDVLSLCCQTESRGKSKDEDSITFSPATGKTFRACLNTMGLPPILRVYSPLGNANDVLITFTLNTSKEIVSQFSFFKLYSFLREWFVYACATYMQYPQKPEGGIRSLGLKLRVWESNQCS